MRALIGLIFALVACQSHGTDTICRTLSFEDVSHIVCAVDRSAPIELFLYAENGQPIAQFDGLPAGVHMAMNAGMYHPDRRPVGLYVQDGMEVAGIVTNPGPGNFGMVPNGVFWSDGQTVHVTETLAFADMEVAPVFATQSGPMLVIDGKLHPRFLIDSDSRKRRNGVGIAGDEVVFVISDAPVTFHHFARLFRDEIGAHDALFLDGSVSRIYAPELDRSERGSDLGPIIAIMAEN